MNPEAGGPRPEGERGATALLVAMGSTLVAMMALVCVGVVTDLLLTGERAITAAEASALAAAASSPLAGGAGQPHREAAVLADANGARVVEVTRAAWPRRVTVTVAVRPGLRLVRAVRGAVHASAAAEVRPGPPVPASALHAYASAPGDSRQAEWTVPVVGRVSSRYGWRRHPVHGDRRMHAGIDIAAPTGTPIRAVAGGVVTAAGGRGGYGLTVDIAHGDGLTTRYAHASRLAVAPGATVDVGQVIAWVGSTGTATGPHLHFEVREHGTAVDPAARLRLPRRAGTLARRSARPGPR